LAPITNTTSAFITSSYQKYDKFKGPGTLEKWQFNGKIYQSLGGKDDFLAIGFHYNRNRVNSYRTLSLAEIAQFGTKFDYFPTCTPATPHAGVVDNDGAGNANDPTTAASCTNYIGQRVNPSNTGNIRG